MMKNLLTLTIFRGWVSVDDNYNLISHATLCCILFFFSLLVLSCQPLTCSLFALID
jgi:hypothetical protein